ncbi:hypothetical protein H0H87_011640 [Tephrocybe sp. NHM501043]|nr:hypothetical protein H0H87_011640 [Tephrocybe sp. NHM501043]
MHAIPILSSIFSVMDLPGYLYSGLTAWLAPLIHELVDVLAALSILYFAMIVYKRFLAIWNAQSRRRYIKVEPMKSTKYLPPSPPCAKPRFKQFRGKRLKDEHSRPKESHHERTKATEASSTAGRFPCPASTLVLLPLLAIPVPSKPELVYTPEPEETKLKNVADNTAVTTITGATASGTQTPPAYPVSTLDLILSMPSPEPLPELVYEPMDVDTDYSPWTSGPTLATNLPGWLSSTYQPHMLQASNTAQTQLPLYRSVPRKSRSRPLMGLRGRVRPKKRLPPRPRLLPLKAAAIDLSPLRLGDL